MRRLLQMDQNHIDDNPDSPSTLPAYDWDRLYHRINGMTTHRDRPIRWSISTELEMSIHMTSYLADHHDFTEYRGAIVRYGAVFIYSKRARKREADAPPDVTILKEIAESMDRIIRVHNFVYAYISQYRAVRPNYIADITIREDGTYNSTTHQLTLQYYLRHPWLSSGLIEVYHCPTTAMTADIHTKALAEEPFNRHANDVLGRRPSHSNLPTISGTEATGASSGGAGAQNGGAITIKE